MPLVPATTRTHRKNAVLTLLAQARDKGGEANGQIWWWYPEVLQKFEHQW